MISILEMPKTSKEIGIWVPLSVVIQREKGLDDSSDLT
jgi:hypothetical protein